MELDDRVLALRSAVPGWENRLQAAVLSRPAALVAGRSAAHLLGFSGFPQSKPEILVPFAGNARSPLARVIRSRHFDQIDTVSVDGFMATSRAETILTLSFRESRATLERVIDSQLASKLLRIEEFDPILDRLHRAPLRGLSTLRSLVVARDANAYVPPSSELERHLYRLLERRGLPPYQRQLPIKYPTLAATVDAYVPRWRLIVEADGRRWHTRVADFEADRARDNAAAAAGIQVLRFSYSMLKRTSQACLETLFSTGRWRESA